MHKGIRSLYSIIKTRSVFSALCGDTDIFISASRKSVKVISRHNEGFILYYCCPSKIRNLATQHIFALKTKPPPISKVDITI